MMPADIIICDGRRPRSLGDMDEVDLSNILMLAKTLIEIDGASDQVCEILGEDTAYVDDIVTYINHAIDVIHGE